MQGYEMEDAEDRHRWAVGAGTVARRTNMGVL